MDHVYGTTTSFTEELSECLVLNPNLHIEEVSNLLDLPPCSAELLVTNGLLEKIPLVDLGVTLQRMDAASPKAIHILAIDQMSSDRAVGLSCDDWVAMFLGLNPQYRLASVDVENEEPGKLWLTFIKGHPAFLSERLADVLAECEALAGSGMYLAARSLLEERLQMDLEEEELFLGLALGNILMAQGFLDDAQNLFTGLARRCQGEPLAQINLFGALVLNGKEVEAREVATEALRCFPEDPDVQDLSLLLGGAMRSQVTSPVEGVKEAGLKQYRIGIISGYYPGERFNSQINHKAYADYHGYYYIFNSSPERDSRNYFRKIETIKRYIDLFDWIFWIDDDAYFTNFEISLENFILNAETSDLIICKSPSTKKLFTKFSSGQFLLRNSMRSHLFLNAVMEVDLEKVRAFWREDLGYFSDGDQDAMVYLSEMDSRFGGDYFQTLDHYAFNNRDFEYQARLEEHFLVHFTGTSKIASKAGFCNRLGVNSYLVPDVLLKDFRIEAYNHLG